MISAVLFILFACTLAMGRANRDLEADLGRWCYPTNGAWMRVWT